MDEDIQIDLLGKLTLRQGAQVVEQFRTRKTALLLGYLACFPMQPHPREELVERFWPETDPEVAHNRFRVTLAALKRSLTCFGVQAQEVLLSSRSHIQLRCSTDAAQFEGIMQAVRQTQDETAQTSLLTQAVELYRGPLLAGEYEDWIMPERERLADVYLYALRRLTRNLAQGREFDRALEYARRSIVADPLREESHRALMRLYMAVGRPAAAVRQYRELETLLQAEFAALPTETTHAIVAPYLTRQVVVPTQAAMRSPTVPSEQPPGRTASTVTPLLGASKSPLPFDSLPRSFTRFFGREAELLELYQRLQPSDPHLFSCESLSSASSLTGGVRPFDGQSSPSLLPISSRLITITGPGGVGKTRMAIEAVRQLQTAYQGRIWFVSLASLTDQDLILDTLAEALQVARSESSSLLNSLVQALSGSPALLLLDNCEHLPLVEPLGALRERLPNLTLLTTSRQSLGLVGEETYLLAPLPVPYACRPSEGMEAAPSVQLFVDRCRNVSRTFRLTPRYSEAVSELCRQLDGLPLALELAAAWASLLNPAQLLTHFTRRLDLFSEQAGVPARHRSLREAIAWSYRLLSPDLQRLFAQLAVFRGGWTLEAAASLSRNAAGPLSSPSLCTPDPILDPLRRLQERSMVIAEESGTEMRYRMLETLREFAREQWDATMQQTLPRLHAAYYTEWMTAAKPQLSRSDQKEWLERLEVEQDNFRAALEWSGSPEGDAETGLRLAAELWHFWDKRGYYAEGRAWLKQILSHPHTQGRTAARARALYGASVLASRQKDYPAAQALCEESRHIDQELGNRTNLALSLHVLSDLAIHTGDYAAGRALLEESLEIHRELENRQGIAETLGNLGLVIYEQGDYKAARAMLEESLKIDQELGNIEGMAYRLNLLGNVATSQEEYAAGSRYYEQSLTLCRDLRDKRGMAAALGNLGMVAYEQGDYASARPLYEQGMALYEEIGNRSGVAVALHNIAELSYMQQEYAEAQRLYAASLILQRAVGSHYTIAYTLEAFAALAAALSHWERAASLFGAARNLRKTVGLPLPPREQDGCTQALQKVQIALGEAAFAAALAAGGARSLEASIAYALEENHSETTG